MSVEIIAEAGVNHNGSLDLARQLIDVAASAGANYVKFQTFKTELALTMTAPKAAYQVVTTGEQESQFQMVKKLELTASDHAQLLEHARLRGIQFLSTPFDLESVDLLTEQLRIRTIKVASGEITNAPLLLKVAMRADRIILSTGMSTLGDVEDALGVVAFGLCRHELSMPSRDSFRRAFASDEGQFMLRERVTLLHCTTEYPAPYSAVNLRALDTLRAAFDLPVGYSDHTEGIEVAIAAVARGAVLIEKHITTDRSLPGPDHRASLEPEPFVDMVQSIRNIEAALGSGLKRPAPCELENAKVARKCLVAARNIQRGEVFTTEMIATKRPDAGESPMDYWSWLGRTATRDFYADEVLS